MSQTGTIGKQVDTKLEVDVIPVSDVERSKQFYERLGWRLDDDDAPARRHSHRPVHAPGLSVLGHVRQGNNSCRAWLGRRWTDRLRHHSGPRRTRRPWHRRE